MNGVKGQMNMVVLVIAILGFVSVMVFLVALLPQDQGQEEYLRLLASSLMLTVMRSDTGINDQECGTVADLLACSVTKPEYRCPGTELTCREAAEQKVSEVFGNYSYLKKYDILVYTDSKGFVTQGDEVRIGNADLLESRREKFSGGETIQKIAGDGTPIVVEVNLLLAEKG